MTGTADSDSPAAIIRRGYEQFNAGDWDAFLTVVSPDVAFHASPGIDAGGTYHGHSGTREFLDNFKAQWSSFVFLVDRCEEVEPGVVLIDGRAQATSRTTALEFDEPFVAVGTVRDGLVTQHGTLFGEHEIAEGPGWVGAELRRLGRAG
jgi:ketosteroid isomerase-like protein